MLYGNLLIFYIDIIIYKRIDFIFLRNKRIYAFRTVYLVRRKKDLKLFVIKAQDLNAVKYSPSKVYNCNNIDPSIWIKYRIRHLFRNSESIRRDTMPEKIETSKYSILLWSMEEK